MYVRQKMITEEQFCFHVLSCSILFYHVPLTSLLSRVYRQQVLLDKFRATSFVARVLSIKTFISRQGRPFFIYIEVFRVHLSSFPFGRTHEQIFPDQKLA